MDDLYYEFDHIKSIIESNIEVPYKIHLVEFDTEQDFGILKKMISEKNSCI